MILYDWDHGNINFAAWDLDEELFKSHWEKLDLLNDMDRTVRDIDDRLSEIRAFASRMDLHPIEIQRVDGIGSMEELLHDKTRLLIAIMQLRDSLPVLANTD